MAKPNLKIEKLEQTLKDGTELWMFMKHSGDESNYDLRWAVGHRPNTDWWGVIAMFPATHERALDRIPMEMELAKQAITILKGKLLKT